jgi:tRNA A37 threonylcarbamoyladenosine biosynthesis protein TsaE
MKLEHVYARKAVYNADLGAGAAVTREACTKKTREEILKDIKAWAGSADGPPVFWLTGQAGSGKTTIAYTIAQYFDGLEKEERTVLGGSFFCSRQFEETRRRVHIIPTLVYQLAQKSRSYAHALHKLDKFDSVELTEQMEDLLVGPWQKSEPQRHTELPPFLIVVDALDEIEKDGRSKFLDILKTIDRRSLRGLKFLVTSRPDPQVVELCESFSSNAFCRLQDVPIVDVRSDIIKYLHVKLPNFAGRPELETMAQLADGLFISAATIVRYLTPPIKISVDEQCELLRKLHVQQSFSASGSRPLLIDELYQQILRDAFSGLDDDDLFKSRLRILYTFLCTSERTPTSLAAALLSVSDATATAVLNGLHAVLYRKDDRVLWYHTSFPDFIFNQTRFKSTFELDRHNQIFMSICKARHALLTKHCFDVMESLHFNIGGISSSFALDADDPEQTKRIDTKITAVLGYASRYWAHHLAHTDETNVDGKDLSDCITDFLCIRVLFWIEAMNLLQSSGQCTTMLQRARAWVLKVGILSRWMQFLTLVG